MKDYEFDATILKREGMDAAFVEFPFDVEAEFGTRGQVKVKATIDGRVEYRGSLATMGHRCHILGLTQQIRKDLGKQPGDVVHIVLRQDTEPRTVEVPSDLQEVLARDSAVQAFFASLSYTSQKEYVRWIESAKQEETRKRRLERAFSLLKERRRHP